jgi:hypothetical protein
VISRVPCSGNHWIGVERLRLKERTRLAARLRPDVYCLFGSEGQGRGGLCCPGLKGLKASDQSLWLVVTPRLPRRLLSRHRRQHASGSAYQNGLPVIDPAGEEDEIFRHIAMHRDAIAHYDRCVDVQGEAEGMVSDNEFPICSAIRATPLSR